MLRIKRTKAAPPGPLAAITGSPAPAVHYATDVAPSGHITGWTRDEGQARPIADDVAARVKAFYGGRENVGKLAFEPVQEGDQPAAPSVLADASAKQTAALQEEFRKLRQRNAELERLHTQDMAEFDDLAAKQREALAAKAAECEKLTARVAELETALAAAQQAQAPSKPKAK